MSQALEHLPRLALYCLGDPGVGLWFSSVPHSGLCSQDTVSPTSPATKALAFTEPAPHRHMGTLQKELESLALKARSTDLRPRMQGLDYP